MNDDQDAIHVAAAPAIEHLPDDRGAAPRQEQLGRTHALAAPGGGNDGIAGHGATYFDQRSRHTPCAVQSSHLAQRNPVWPTRSASRKQLAEPVAHIRLMDETTTLRHTE